MKMLQESFEPEHWPEGSEQRSQCEQIACLYFSGWLFEGYDDAKSAILSSVLVALGEHKRFGPKVRAKCVSLLKSVNWMRVAHLGLKHAAIPHR
jgi:predicted KAP-like P-loop ATPase